jgi:branched-chain amino acid aminotransferase group I
MENIVYLNGSLIPRSKAHISISDHGFLYGYGLFQTMRAYHGKLFLLDRHVKRLKEAAQIIGIGKKVVGLDLEKACQDTVKINGLDDARVRLTVTNGEGTALPWVDAGGAPTVLITALPYAPYSKEKYEEGFKVGIASVRRTRQSVISSMKSINYLLNVVARVEVAQRGMDEALLLNEDGFLAEGGGSNIFFIRSGRLVTPAPNSGIIPGVTREVVIELAAGLSIGVSEGTVGKGAFKQCEEAFMTNALIEIMPVNSVSDETGQSVTIGAGKMGDITRKIAQAYREMVEKATGTALELKASLKPKPKSKSK